MTYLTPSADRVVREAVDEYIQGRRRPSVPPAAFVETRNSRYRLTHGTVVEAADGSLAGAELVGWLADEAEPTEVLDVWAEGRRAVFVDHRTHRHIVVTSQTRTFGDLASRPPAGGPDTQLDGSQVAQNGSSLPRFASSESLPKVVVGGPRGETDEPPTPRRGIPALPPPPRLATGREVGPARPVTRTLPPLAIARPLPPPTPPPRHPATPLPSFAVSSRFEELAASVGALEPAPPPSPVATRSSDGIPLVEITVEEASEDDLPPGMDDDADDEADTCSGPESDDTVRRPPPAAARPADEADADEADAGDDELAQTRERPQAAPPQAAPPRPAPPRRSAPPPPPRRSRAARQRLSPTPG